MKKQPTTHLGNKQLHKQHSVMIEGGAVPRAKVMDQTIIDRYLMQGKLTLAQHHAGEYLLGQAAKAGLWPTGVNLSGTRVEGATPNYVPFGAFPFGRTLVMVRRRFGDFHAYLTREVVCYDWDVSADDYRMGCLRESLDWIDERRMRRNPLHRLRKAVKKGH